MKYDFESIIERQGMDALAVDMPAQARESGNEYFSVPLKDGFDAIPMWVADMNFATVATIPQAIEERIKHPVFGYFFPREEYFDSIIRWQTISTFRPSLYRKMQKCVPWHFMHHPKPLIWRD